MDYCDNTIGLGQSPSVLPFRWFLIILLGPEQAIFQNSFKLDKIPKFAIKSDRNSSKDPVPIVCSVFLQKLKKTKKKFTPRFYDLSRHLHINGLI